MKRFLSLVGAFVLLLGLSGAVNAYTINYTFVPESSVNANNFASPYFAITENFDGSSLAWTWTGSYAVVTGDSTGQYSAPAGINGNKDQTKYVTVPAPLTNGGGSVKVTDLGGTYNYFGLWWGSMDTYNTFKFYDGNTMVLTLTGTDVAIGNNANGNQTAPATNHYVNFLGLPDFDSFELSSTEKAFEADNIAIGNVAVPEPATLLLLGLGLVGLAGVKRKFNK